MSEEKPLSAERLTALRSLADFDLGRPAHIRAPHPSERELARTTIALLDSHAALIRATERAIGHIVATGSGGDTERWLLQDLRAALATAKGF